jgi:hypothetical protein
MCRFISWLPIRFLRLWNSYGPVAPSLGTTMWIPSFATLRFIGRKGWLMLRIKKEKLNMDAVLFRHDASAKIKPQ